jgi:imidazole glycerol-phosphate synthase subunit HisH
MIRATILDYGAGNLHSLSKALAMPDVSVQIATDPLSAINTEVLILPGVGAFTGAAGCLAPARTALRRALTDGLPCLAICLGMQLLFDASDEGPGAGLGFLAGRVRRLNAALVPHMGWNTLDDATDPLTTGGTFEKAYYAHSFACPPADPGATTAWTTLDGDRFPAIVRRERTVGVQFHPEKSSVPGVRFIQRFLAEVAGARATAS